MSSMSTFRRRSVLTLMSRWRVSFKFQTTSCSRLGRRLCDGLHFVLERCALTPRLVLPPIRCGGIHTSWEGRTLLTSTCLFSLSMLTAGSGIAKLKLYGTAGATCRVRGWASTFHDTQAPYHCYQQSNRHGSGHFISVMILRFVDY